MISTFGIQYSLFVATMCSPLSIFRKLFAYTLKNAKQHLNLSTASATAVVVRGEREVYYRTTTTAVIWRRATIPHNVSLLVRLSRHKTRKTNLLIVILWKSFFFRYCMFFRCLFDSFFRYGIFLFVFFSPNQPLRKFVPFFETIKDP